MFSEIVKSENEVSEAKLLYNNVTTEFNSVIQSFPVNIMRGFMKVTYMDYYSEPEKEIEINL